MEPLDFRQSFTTHNLLECEQRLAKEEMCRQKSAKALEMEQLHTQPPGLQDSHGVAALMHHRAVKNAGFLNGLHDRADDSGSVLSQASKASHASQASSKASSRSGAPRSHAGTSQISAASGGSSAGTKRYLANKIHSLEQQLSVESMRRAALEAQVAQLMTGTGSGSPGRVPPADVPK